MKILSDLMHTFHRDPFDWVERTTSGHRTLYPVVDPGIYWEVMRDIAKRDHSSYRDHLPFFWRLSNPDRVPSTYLDVSASGQTLLPVRWAFDNMMPHYANTHGDAHPKARIMTEAVEEVHRDILEFVGADPQEYIALVGGAGATFFANIVASLMPSEQKVVLCADSHHASLVPEQIHYGFNPEHIIPLAVNPETFTIDPDSLKKILQAHGGQIGWLVVTAASNVTGHFNPISEIVKIAHQYGVKVAVDVAQYAAHAPISLLDWNSPDFIYGSGHKMDAPGAPGFGVAKHTVLNRIPTIGGGAQVKVVNMQKTTFTDDLQARWEPGTPNVPGIVMLGAALHTFKAIGMDKVRAHEAKLIQLMLGQMSPLKDVQIYGNKDLNRVSRAGVMTFNVDGLTHDVVARALADYFNIHVRNGCFCSHPQTENLLHIPSGLVEEIRRKIEAGEDLNVPGMIRASMGLYTTPEDIYRLVAAVKWIISHKKKVKEAYVYTQGRHGRNLVRKDGWSVDIKKYNPLPEFY